MFSLLTVKSELSLCCQQTIADTHDVSYNYRQRNSLCFSMKIFLIKLLAQNCPSTRYRSYLMKYILRRIIANMPAALYQYALALVSTGQCAVAMKHLNRSIIRGHLPSRALMAHLLLGESEGVVMNNKKVFQLAEEGTRLGCHHCQGVLAYCYLGHGIKIDTALSLELARKSSGKGSKYGQFVLGMLYHYGLGGVARDCVQAVAFYRLAAVQNFDMAQLSLGSMYSYASGVAQDYAEALRLFYLAAAQGHTVALCQIAIFHEHGYGICKNKAEAIRWYRRAQAAGNHSVAIRLQELSA